MPLRSLLLLVILILPAGAEALFIPPDPTEALFQRDLLPIDPDRMRTLSAQLAVLATRPPKAEPAQFRAISQALAIAGRLNPANTRVRSIAQGYSRQEKPASPDQRQLQRALSEIWQMIDWLQTEEAGPEGQLLGAQLLDALHVIDPSHPRAAQHDANGEANRWLGVVAPLEEFTPAKPPIKPGPEESEQPQTQEMTLIEADPGPSAPAIALRTGQVRSPLFVYDQAYQQALRLVPVALKINEMQEEGTLGFGLDPAVENLSLSTAQDRVRSALLTLWPALPEKEFAILSTDNQRCASRNGTAISAPAGLLLHAAISGKTLREDLIILGDLQADGRLTRPRYAWDYLAALREGPGGRLLVPPDLKEELEALIVLEHPEFFIKYEVLLVSSLDTALRLGTPGGDPPDLAEASAVFAEIQSAAEGRQLGPLTALESVRSRLVTIRQAAPYHFSASALLLQGSGKNRPTHLETTILARELARSLDPMGWIVRIDSSNLEYHKVLASWELTRKGLDEVEEFVEIKDRPFHQAARDLSDDIRSLTRELKRSPGSETSPKAARLLSEIRQKHNSFLKQVALATGEPLENLPPWPLRDPEPTQP